MMNRIRNVVCLGLLFLSFVTAAACACSCAFDPAETALAAMEKFDAVFTGTVIQIAEVVPQSVLKVKLDVLKSYKGDSSGSVEVKTAVIGPMCGFPFEKDTEYLVFASLYEDGLHVSLCSPTKKLAEAAKDMEFLEVDAGRAP